MTECGGVSMLSQISGVANDDEGNKLMDKCIEIRKKDYQKKMMAAKKAARKAIKHFIEQ